MYTLNREKVLVVLVAEGYTLEKAEALIQDYPLLTDQLGAAVEQWLVDRSIINVQAEGLSLQEIIDQQRVHFLVAIRELNVFLDPSITPERRLQLRKALLKPLFFE